MVYGDENDVKLGRCDRWRVRSANSLPRHFYLPQVVNWEGISSKVVFGGREWEASSFADFMGWYLSEGCTSTKRGMTRIVQKKDGRYVSEIDRVMAATPFPYHKGKNNDRMLVWWITDHKLADHLAPLGKSLQKMAPEEVKNLSPDNLRRFLVAYAMGDGNFQVRNPAKITIGTGSSRMANDLHECSIKAGWSSSLLIRQQPAGTFFNGYARRECTIYKLYLRASKAIGQERKIGSRIRPENVKTIDYDDDVYCVSVPSTAIVVRRNGRVSVSGNCLPMRFDETRRSVTVRLPQYDDEEPWSDPREEEGELMWPERFGEKEVTSLENALGPYLASGRLQQKPTPKGGGIIKRDWWQPWDMEEARLYGLEWGGGRKEFPPFELVAASLDTSYGQKQENDYNALTIWGIWIDRNKNRRAMLMFAWNKRLALHGKVIAQKVGEAAIQFKERQKAEWGLIEWVADTCKRYKVRRLLIENKTRGIDVANEINRLYARENWGVQLINPIGDKVSRVHSIVPLFTDNAIWAPDTRWATDLVITQCENFPKDDHDDLVDSVSMFLGWARENGLIERADEATAAALESAAYKGHQPSVAGQYGVGG